MTRYIFIDNSSGYIWGDGADINGKFVEGTPITVARAMDTALGYPDRRYEAISLRDLASNETGYHVYAAETYAALALPIVEDGQNQELIEAVERECEYVCTLRVSAPDDDEGWI